MENNEGNEETKTNTPDSVDKTSNNRTSSSDVPSYNLTTTSLKSTTELSIPTISNETVSDLTSVTPHSEASDHSGATFLIKRIESAELEKPSTANITSSKCEEGPLQSTKWMKFSKQETAVSGTSASALNFENILPGTSSSFMKGAPSQDSVPCNEEIELSTLKRRTYERLKPILSTTPPPPHDAEAAQILSLPLNLQPQPFEGVCVTWIFRGICCAICVVGLVAAFWATVSFCTTTKPVNGTFVAHAAVPGVLNVNTTENHSHYSPAMTTAIPVTPKLTTNDLPASESNENATTITTVIPVTNAETSTQIISLTETEEVTTTTTELP